MKTYSLCIIDSEGENILDREMTADEVIDMLRKNAEYKEPVIEGYNAPMKEKKTYKKRSDSIVSVSLEDEPKKKRGIRVKYDIDGIIRELARDVLSNDEIAEKFGVTKSTVKNVKFTKKAEIVSFTTGSTTPKGNPNFAKVKKMHDEGKHESEIYAEMHDFMTDAEFRQALELAKQ